MKSKRKEKLQNIVLKYEPIGKLGNCIELRNKKKDYATKIPDGVIDKIKSDKALTQL